jgi:glycosyltransferase involved in cell wall biosynthesis
MVHGCYRGSTLQTGAVAVMSTAHKLLRTWTRTVALFFVMSEFAKQKFVENGLLVSRMLVKRNFVVDPGAPGAGGEAFLYAGRLSREKGTHVLLNAIALTRSPDAKFLIVGDGPLESGVREAALRDPRITFYGRLPLHDVMRMMASARAVIVPSDCYETFGRVAAEALAVGTPVICTDGGAVTEVVENTKTGFHFRQSDPADLARIIDAAGTGAGPLEAMRGAARIAYEAKYTPEIGYQLLLRGFRTAIRAPCESGSDLTIAPRR